MTEQNWDWENTETLGRGLPDEEFQPLDDPVLEDDILGDPLVDEHVIEDPLKRDF